jgi:hypothetical protein
VENADCSCWPGVVSHREEMIYTCTYSVMRRLQLIVSETLANAGRPERVIKINKIKWHSGYSGENYFCKWQHHQAKGYSPEGYNRQGTLECGEPVVHPVGVIDPNVAI